MLVPSNRAELSSRKEGGGARRIAANIGWRWTAFTSSARKDNLVLKHWQRQDKEFPDYPFAKFNKKAQILDSYTDAEYAEHVATLPSSQPGSGSDSPSQPWSRADTDRLLVLCRLFDLRWLVIADRYTNDEADVPGRDVESLKDRFYSVQRALCAARGMLDQADKYQYDPVHERKRKQQLTAAFTRTRSIELEEVSCVYFSEK